uniref:Uncharacterized protein n=1 Tax=Trypanosoma congolense (strain IL3000) TaxID=1068625 RepID=G0UML9_TRYCI|nr:hypothetical protein, unlikely [Trypanosoma congolense IL3000]
MVEHFPRTHAHTHTHGPSPRRAFLYNSGTTHFISPPFDLTLHLPFPPPPLRHLTPPHPRSPCSACEHRALPPCLYPAHLLQSLFSPLLPSFFPLNQLRTHAQRHQQQDMCIYLRIYPCNRGMQMLRCCTQRRKEETTKQQ